MPETSSMRQLAWRYSRRVMLRNALLLLSAPIVLVALLILAPGTLSPFLGEPVLWIFVAGYGLIAVLGLVHAPFLRRRRQGERAMFATSAISE